MRILLTVILLFTGLIFCRAQNSNPNYDSTLAKELGADAYGMKSYVMVILRSGTNTTEPKASRDSLFAGHLQNIGRLVEMKKMIVAGPFGKNGDDMRGIFILDVKTLEEAASLMDTDPAIKAKLLRPEMYTWYGSAALPVYLKAADMIWKINP